MSNAKVQLYDAASGEDLIGHLVHALTEQKEIVIQMEGNFLLVNGERSARIRWFDSEGE